MKRSEMLNKLEDILIEVSRMEYNVPMGELRRERAEYILTKLENIGMLPPPYYDSFYHDEPECDGMIPEWEDER